MPTYRALILNWDKMSREQRFQAGSYNADEQKAALRAALTFGHFTRFELDAASVEDVYERLNMAHPAEYRALHLRSLSMGDVVVAPDGLAHQCASFGWHDVTALVDEVVTSLALRLAWSLTKSDTTVQQLTALAKRPTPDGAP